MVRLVFVFSVTYIFILVIKDDDWWLSK